jgi:hypothetical protein
MPGRNPGQRGSVIRKKRGCGRVGMRMVGGSPDIETEKRGCRATSLLPVLERRIEEALKSPNPLDPFTDKMADPKRAINLAAATIAYAADGLALEEISKLLAIDDGRFVRL